MQAPVEDIRALKPFLTGDPPWVLLVVAIAIALGLAWLAWTLSRPKESKRPASVTRRSSEPRTLRGRLDALRKSGLIEQGASAKVCDELSDIIRDFLRQRYGMLSRRLTTSELLAELERRGVPEGILNGVAEIARACDLVKFAKIRLDAMELRQHLTTAYLVIDSHERLSDVG